MVTTTDDGEPGFVLGGRPWEGTVRRFIPLMTSTCSRSSLFTVEDVDGGLRLSV